jgi:protein-tyrosine phosphatase
MALSQNAIISLKILFVCLGNICRSPAAHGTMQHLITKHNLTNIEVDSAGTSSWHTGSLPDDRMRSAGITRGIQLNHRSRQVNQKDFEYYDLIVAMDDSNYNNLRRLGDNKYNDKIKKMIHFINNTDYKQYSEIPDPYYGDTDDFNTVLDLVYEGCMGILKQYNYL